MKTTKMRNWILGAALHYPALLGATEVDSLVCKANLGAVPCSRQQMTVHLKLEPNGKFQITTFSPFQCHAEASTTVDSGDYIVHKASSSPTDSRRFLSLNINRREIDGVESMPPRGLTVLSLTDGTENISQAANLRQSWLRPAWDKDVLESRSTIVQCKAL